MVPDPSLILNDVIMTSQLLFKIILNFFDNFLILLGLANIFNNMSS